MKIIFTKTNCLVLVLFCLFGKPAFSQVYTENFGSSIPTGWVITNGGQGNNWGILNSSTYSYNGTGSTGSYSLRYSYSTQAANAWAITKAIPLTAGKAYRVEFYQRVRSASYAERMKVTVGTSQTIGAQSTTLLDLPSLTNTSYANRTTDVFVAPTSGNYYFGFNCYSVANRYELYIDYIKVFEVLPVIEVSPSSLSQFISSANTPSSQQYYTVSGQYVQSAITVSAPSDFEISLAGGAQFNPQSSLTINAVNGVVPETRIYVRSNTSDPNHFSGNISNTSGSTTVNVPVSGNNAICNGINKVVNILNGVLNWTGLNFGGNGMPQACDNVTMNFSASDWFSPQTVTVNLNEPLVVNNLVIKGSSSGFVSHTLVFNTNGYPVHIRGNLTVTSENGSSAYSRVIFRVSGNSQVTVDGNIELEGNSGSLLGIGYGNNAIIEGVGAGNEITVRKNVLIDNLSAVNNIGLVVDGNTAQTITNNSGSILTLNSLTVGNENSATLSLAGGIKATLINGGDLQVNNNSTLNLVAGTRIRQVAAGNGAFKLNDNATMNVADINGNFTAGSSYTGITGSNFPYGFNTYSASAASTVNYNGAAQSIYGGLNYGNLAFAGGQKTAPAVLEVKGNLVNEGASFVHNNGLVKLSGSNNQDFAGLAYNSLVLSGGYTKQTVGNSSIADSLKLDASTVLKLNANDSITLRSAAAKTASFARMGAGSSINYGTNAAFVVERFIPATGKAWFHLAAPAKGQTIKQAWQEGASTPNGNPRPGFGTMLTSNLPDAVATHGYDVYTPAGASIKIFDPATANWVSAPSTSTQISTNTGYMLFVRGDRGVTAYNQAATTTTLRTAGKLYTNGGDAPSVSSVQAGRFASIANPYASAIDFSKLSRTGGVQNVFYVWDPRLTGTYGYGAFQTFIHTGGGNYSPVIPGGSYQDGNTAIESGMAFMVHATSAGTVGFSENAKSTGSRMVFRPGGLNDQLRIVMYAMNGTEQTVVDAALMMYDENNSNSIDDADVRKLKNTGENISIVSGGLQLTAESRSSILPGDTIHLAVANLQQRTYVFDVQGQDLGDASLVPVMVDRFTGLESPLNLDGSTTITFDVTADAASKAANRFFIVFKPGNIVPVTMTRIAANRIDAKNVVVKWDAENEYNIEAYTIERSNDGYTFTSVGEMPAASNNHGSAAYSFNDDKASSAEYFYRVKALSIGGMIQYSAIVKVSAISTTADYSIYPNPVQNKLINLYTGNDVRGNIKGSVMNMSGAVITKFSFNSNGRGANMIQLPASAPAGSYIVVIENEKERKTIRVNVL